MDRSRPDATAAPRAAALAVAGIGLASAAVWFGMRIDANAGARFDLLNLVEIAAFLAFVLLGSLLVLRRPGHPSAGCWPAWGSRCCCSRRASSTPSRG